MPKRYHGIIISLAAVAGVPACGGDFGLPARGLFCTLVQKRSVGFLPDMVLAP
jgi:hypothetical protein